MKKGDLKRIFKQMGIGALIGGPIGLAVGYFGLEKGGIGISQETILHFIAPVFRYTAILALGIGLYYFYQSKKEFKEAKKLEQQMKQNVKLSENVYLFIYEDSSGNNYCVFSGKTLYGSEALNIDYFNIKDAFVKRETTKDFYLDVNENLRGYAGMCLPKDTKALDSLVKELNLDLKLFEVIDHENDKFTKTVFNNQI